MGGHGQPGLTLRRAPAAPSRVHPGAGSDGEVGKEVRTPPKALQANFCIRSCDGGLKGESKAQSWGICSGPFPSRPAAPCSPSRGESEQLRTASPALPCARGLTQPHQVSSMLQRTLIPLVPSPARPGPARTPSQPMWLCLAALGSLCGGVWRQRAPPGAGTQV